MGKVKVRKVNRVKPNLPTGQAFRLAPSAISCVANQIWIFAGAVQVREGATDLQIFVLTARGKDEALEALRILRSNTPDSYPIFVRDAVLAWLQDRVPSIQHLLVPVTGIQGCRRHDDDLTLRSTGI